MKLILSKFDLKKKIVIIYALPNQNLSEEIQEDLIKIYDDFENKAIVEEKVYYDFGPYLSYLFNVPSAWYPEETETVLLTLYFEEHENTLLMKQVMEKTVDELLAIPQFSKILYLNTPHTDQEAYKVLGKVIQILTNCFFEVNKLHSNYNIGLAEVLILGTKAGGKTSIVDYLIHGKFIPQTAPTLSPIIYNLFYKQIDFRVLDVCCDAHVKQVMKDHPIEPGKLPQAIVYVTDATLEGEKLDNAISKFKEWINFLSKQYPPDAFKKIPILILFNKVDLVPYFDEVKYEEIYTPDILGLNLKYASVSAKTGEGLNENFGWLVKRLKVTAKL